MPEYVHLEVMVEIPDLDREKQLRLHVLENFRDNWLDADIFAERTSTSGFGQSEYNRMVETLGREDLLTKEHWLHALGDRRRLSRLGEVYLLYLGQLNVPQVVAPVPPMPFLQISPAEFTAESPVVEPAERIPDVLPVASKPFWQNFWRKDVAVITGIVGTAAMVAIALIQCGAG